LLIRNPGVYGWTLAIDAAQNSLSLFPCNSHAWNNLGVALKKQEEHLLQAIEAYENALECDSYNTGAMVNLAIALQESGKYQQIPQYLIKALNLRPMKSTLIFNAGNIATQLVQDGHSDEAKTILQALTKADENNINAWYNLALIYWHQERIDEAIASFEKVHCVNPSDDFVCLSLAKLYFHKKKPKDAITYCNKLIQMGKEVTKAVSIKAQVINFCGGYHEAVTLLEGFLKHNQDNDALWIVLSEIHEYRDNQKLALSAALKCKKMLSENMASADPQNVDYVNSKIAKLSVLIGH